MYNSFITIVKNEYDTTSMREFGLVVTQHGEAVRVGPARRIQSDPWLSRASRLDIDLRRVESALCRQSTHEPGRDKSGELPWASFWGAATARCHNLAD